MFSLVGWQAKAGEYVIAAVLCFSAYHYIGHRAVESYKAEVAIAQAKVDKETQDKYNKVSQELETLKLTRAQNATTITKEKERIIERPVYLSVCLDDDGLRLINDSLKGGPTSKPSATLPTAKTP